MFDNTQTVLRQAIIAAELKKYIPDVDALELQMVALEMIRQIDEVYKARFDDEKRKVLLN
jgi:hypothetical protein